MNRLKGGEGLAPGFLLGKMLLLRGYVCGAAGTEETNVRLGCSSSLSRAEGSWQKCWGGTEGARAPQRASGTRGQPE